MYVNICRWWDTSPFKYYILCMWWRRRRELRARSLMGKREREDCNNNKGSSSSSGGRKQSTPSTGTQHTIALSHIALRRATNRACAQSHFLCLSLSSFLSLFLPSLTFKLKPIGRERVRVCVSWGGNKSFVRTVSQLNPPPYLTPSVRNEAKTSGCWREEH